MAYNEDREVLIDFLYKTYDFVKFLYSNPTDFINPENISEQFIITDTNMLKRAWEEFDESFEIQVEEEKILSASDEALVSHGLFGNQLDLKLHIIERLRSLWENNFYVSGLLKKLIDAIDNLLESLIQATGIDGALKELKDAYSVLID